MNPDDTLTIRPVVAENFADVATLYCHLIPNDVPAAEPLQRQVFKDILDHPGMTVLLGCRYTKPIATCTLVVIPNLTRGCAPYALIENVVTDNGHRGIGYGGELLSAAIDLAWQAKCYKVMLMSGQANRKAHRFYERLGFATTKTGFELRALGYLPRTPD